MGQEWPEPKGRHFPDGVNDLASVSLRRGYNLPNLKSQISNPEPESPKSPAALSPQQHIALTPPPTPSHSRYTCRPSSVTSTSSCISTGAGGVARGAGGATWLRIR